MKYSAWQLFNTDEISTECQMPLCSFISEKQYWLLYNF